MRGKRISRQLKKAFGASEVEALLAECRPILEGISDELKRRRLEDFIRDFPDFLSNVDAAYVQLEDRLAMAERSLEVGSQELNDANSRLYDLNRTFDALLNSLGQGFLIFGSDGVCLPVYSKPCEALLEIAPPGRSIGDVLRVNTEKRAMFNKWLALLFREPIDFADLAATGPKRFPSTAGLVVELEYKCIRDMNGKVANVVVIATDRTAEAEAKEEAYRMQARALLAASVLTDKRNFIAFIGTARKFLSDLKEIVGEPQVGTENLLKAKRWIHTLKGAAGGFGMLEVRDCAHELETNLTPDGALYSAETGNSEALREGVLGLARVFENTISNNWDVIGDALDAKEAMREVPLSNLNNVRRLILDMGSPASSVREKFDADILDVPLRKIFRQFEAPVRQAAKTLGKRVLPIVYEGADMGVYPERFEAVFGSLIHIFNNLVDHGIETEAERVARGKAPEGCIRVACERLSDGSRLRISISDDGAGIDVEKVRATVQPPELAHKLSESELIQRIFAAGVSTAASLSKTCGRGIGLAEVKAQVESVGGSVRVETRRGQGTKFILELPALRHAAACGL